MIQCGFEKTNGDVPQLLFDIEYLYILKQTNNILQKKISEEKAKFQKSFATSGYNNIKFKPKTTGEYNYDEPPTTAYGIDPGPCFDEGVQQQV